MVEKSKMRKFLFLIFILSFGLLFGAEFEVTSKIEHNVGHMGLQLLDDMYKYDHNDDLCALLIIRCGLDGMNFYNSVSKVAQIEKDGDYWVTMKKDAKYIVLKKEGFGNYKEDFGLRLKSGYVYEMSIDEKFKQVSEIPIMISTNQNGAEVFIDGELVGRTKNKMFTTKVNLGSAKIELKKDGYTTLVATEDITALNYTFDYNLDEILPVAVNIETIPAGATIYIADLKFGTTPKRGFFEAGTYPIRIVKDNYETIVDEIVIEEPAIYKSYLLSDNRATLTINTYPNATVRFNDNSYQGSVINHKITAQILEVVVDIPKAESITKVVTLKPNSENTFDIFPYIQTGTIQVLVTPARGEITLFGDGGEHYVSKGKRSFQNIPVGKYQLMVTSKGYKTYNHSVILSLEQVLRIEIELEPGRNASEVTPKGFVYIPSGTFHMGRTKGKGESDELPAHEVYINSFYMAKTEVTQSLWISIMGRNPSTRIGSNIPVDRVSWSDAVKFSNRLSKKKGLNSVYSVDGSTDPNSWGEDFTPVCNFEANGYRLPTEAEWEYVARGTTNSSSALKNSSETIETLISGGKRLLSQRERSYFLEANEDLVVADFLYSGSNIAHDVAWTSSISKKNSQHVATKQPNKIGIFDMSGNLYEWCWDIYGSYSRGRKDNPKGAEHGKYRIIRGGGWTNTSYYSRVVSRGYIGEKCRTSGIGFRLCRSVD